MSTKLFHAIVGYGIALTAVIEGGAACGDRAKHVPMREGPPPSPCVPSNPCSVYGTVTDASGKPMAGVAVRVGSETLTTGADGTYRSGPLAVEYDVTIEATLPDGRRAIENINFHQFGGPRKADLKLDDLPQPPPPPNAPGQDPPEPPLVL